MNTNYTKASVQEIAGRIKSDIRHGGYMPGSKLPGMRTLSEKLRVDRNIIRAALDSLETQGAVTKKARSGVFVSPNMFSSNLRELYIYTHCQEGTRQVCYVEQALELHRKFGYRRRFNITLRYSGWNKMSKDLLQSELLKARTGNATILVISGAIIDEEKLEILNKMELPYLVIGESQHDLSRFRFNQVYASCAAKGMDIGNFIIRSPYQNIAYFAVPQNTMTYEEEYIDILKKYMRNSEKELIVKRLQYDQHLRAKCSRYYEVAVRELLASGSRPDLLHFSDEIDVQAIARIVGEYGLRVPEDVNILACSQSMKNPIPGIFVVQTDFDKFANEVFDLCEKIADGKCEPEKHNLTHLVSNEILELNFQNLIKLFY